MELKTTLISEDSIALLCQRNGNAQSQDGVFEENVLELYFVAGVLFISEVETLDVNTTGRPQTDTISGIFVLDYYIYISAYYLLSLY